MNDLTLKQLQKSELEILKIIHDFCINYNIKYSLYAGTGIGAVRHSGFIPWDDDIDICMTRNEYIKFVDAWNKHPVDGYFMQNSLTELNLNIDHTKIRKDNTILLSDGEDENDGHHGIWVDIFALDKLPNDEKQCKEVLRNAYKIKIFNRGNRISSKDSFNKKIFKHCLRIIPKSIRVNEERKANKEIQKYKDMSSDYQWVDLSAIYCFKILFPPEIADNYVTVKFDGYDFMMFKDYDKMLRIKYGDYMQYPPKEEQVCKHNPVKIKF